MPSFTIFKIFRNTSVFIVSAVFILAATTVTAHAQQFVEGTDYVVLDGDAKVQKDGTVQVIEFFWYGCPACFQFEPYLESWKSTLPDTIDFIPVPAPLRDVWEFHARVHFALESVDSDGTLPTAMFNEIHKNKNRMRNEKAFLKWVRTLPDVDVEEVANALISFGTVTKLNQAQLLTRKYRINAVPTMVVGGKYRTSPNLAGSEQRSLEIVEYLVNKIIEES